MADRPAALLTNSQRDVLLGKKEASRPRSMESRLRRRVYTGLRTDGPLLLEKLDREERRKIFREWEKGWQDEALPEFPGEMAQAEQLIHGFDPETPSDMEEVERAYLREGIANLLAFLYLGIEEGNVGEFDEILERALSKAARKTDRSLTEFDVDVSMSGVKQYTPQTIAEKVREGDEGLTLREVKFAFQQDALTREEVEAYIEDLDFLDVTDIIGQASEPGGENE